MLNMRSYVVDEILGIPTVKCKQMRGTKALIDKPTWS